MRKLILSAAALVAMGGMAFADPIEGKWKTASGETATIGSCGGAYCITLTTGKHKGKSIGKLSASGGGAYAGSITDPTDDKTYKGKASISGRSMKMSGCVLGGLICKSQSWSKL